MKLIFTSESGPHVDYWADCWVASTVDWALTLFKPSIYPFGSAAIEEEWVAGPLIWSLTVDAVETVRWFRVELMNEPFFEVLPILCNWMEGTEIVLSSFLDWLTNPAFIIIHLLWFAGILFLILLYFTIQLQLALVHIILGHLQRTFALWPWKVVASALSWGTESWRAFWMRAP